MRSLFRWQVIVLLMLLVITISVLPAVTSTRAAGTSVRSNPHTSINKSFRQHYKFLQSAIAPPTDSQCRTHFGFPCYSPQEIRKAYGVTPLLNNGFTGKGQSIVIID